MISRGLNHVFSELPKKRKICTFEPTQNRSDSIEVSLREKLAECCALSEFEGLGSQKLEERLVFIEQLLFFLFSKKITKNWDE